MSFRRAATAAIVVLVLCLAMNARAADVVRGFTHMADISAPRADVVAAEFYPGVKIASAPVITDSAGDVVSSKVLLNQNRGKLIIIFDASGRGGKHTLHYGWRGGADRPKKQWDRVASLTMEVRSKPPGAVNTWSAMQKLARSGEIQGMMFVQNIHHGYNPFGSNDSFITIYRGELVMSEDGDYRLFTASSDDSFVVIDGKLAFSWPGRHGPWGGARAQFGANMHLQKGRHTIEYYHAQVGGRPCMALGWCKKGRKIEQVHVVPPGWFAHTPVAQVTNPRKKDGGAAALFNWTQHELLVFERFQYIRYNFHNRSVGKAKSILWDFGDGVTSTERNPWHIFTGTPPFKVKLTVKDGDKDDTCQINVPMLTPMDNTTINDRITVESFAKLINTYQFEKLPGSVLQPLFELMDTLEQPLLLMPMCKVIKAKFSGRGLGARVTKVLAKAYAIKDPAKAIPLLNSLTSSSDTGTAIEAKVDLLEVYLHKLRNFEKAKLLAESYVATAGVASKMGRLARVKLGDIYLYQGDVQKAEEKYREAQQLAFKDMADREIAVRQGAYGEAVGSYIMTHNFRMARAKLIQWEADFPISKITGDFILMSARYWEAIGDARKSLDNLQALLKVNPITPYLPQIEYRMGNAYRDLGQNEKARVLYEKVLQEYPLNPICSDARVALVGLR